MLPLAEMVLAVAWTFGANGYLIERQAAGSDMLPAAWLAPVSRRVEVAFHGRADWMMAFYVADRAAGARRVVLYAPYYLAPGGLAPSSSMAVDVAEYYYHALLEAALDLEMADGSSYAAWVEARAAKLMTAVPEAQRLSVYAAALADFGAHLLSIRNELARLAERQGAAGRDLCRLVDRPASLFGLWRRSFVDGPYAGGAFVSDGTGLPRWQEGEQPIERVDKDRFVAEVLGVDWEGEPKGDFAEMCGNGA